MSTSARTILKEPKTIEVANVRQLTVDLCVISYVEDRKRYDDVYNVPNASVMATLLLARADHKVTALIVPDGSDADGHPEVKEATAVEL